MIECKTIEEAQKVENVIHVVAGDPVIAYQIGDVLPDYCKTDAELGMALAAPKTIEQRVSDLEAQVAMLTGK